jgi:hypothetical protein
MLKAVRNIFSTQTRYSAIEKQKLAKLCKIAEDEFQDGYHKSAFKQLGIEEPIKDDVIAEERLDFKQFKRFTFSDERLRNDNMYRNLCEWSCSLHKCIKKLIDATGKKDIDFALKALEAILYYLPSQDKVLLNEFNYDNKDKILILNQSIKLRYTFLKLIQENKLCFVEKTIVTANKTQLETEIPTDYSRKLQETDKKIIDAAKSAFICIICSTIEHLKIKKEKAKREQEPSTLFGFPNVDQVIDGECIEIT